MASAKEQLTEMKGQLADLRADVEAATAILTSKAGQLDAEGQAALDDLQGSITGWDGSVGDADGSDTPAPVPAPPVEDPLVEDPNAPQTF